MNQLAKHLGLTPRQWEILEHRLSAGDALADALEGQHMRQMVEDVAGLLALGKLDEALAIDAGIVMDVLADAVEGGTYIGASDGETPQVQAAILRSARGLADKVSKYIGRQVYYPEY